MQRLKKTVALVGMMGAGKTAVGQALARRLDVPFLDSDTEIERAAAMSVAEVFTRDGESFFRAREAEVIARLMEGAPGILSTGGGAFMAETNRQTISQHGVAVFLDADVTLLWNRVRHKETRPLLNTADPLKTLTDLHGVRAPVYALADLTVRSEPRYQIEDMVDAVVQTLRTRSDLWMDKDLSS